MSSVVLWRCPTTGVTASWNKEGVKYTSFVPTHQSNEPGFEGTWEGVTTPYTTKKLAIAGAQRQAAAVIKRREQQNNTQPNQD
jgi:hypothetical protein